MEAAFEIWPVTRPYQYEYVIMKEHHPNPHSITVLSWHLSRQANDRSEGKKDATIESWPDDLKQLPVPSLLLSAS